MFVILAIAALGAALALLTAHLGLPRVADILALASAACGLAAFGAALTHTIRQARRLPPRSERT